LEVTSRSTGRKLRDVRELGPADEAHIWVGTLCKGKSFQGQPELLPEAGRGGRNRNGLQIPV